MTAFNRFTLLALLVTLALAQSAQAAKGDGAQGQPFQALQADIDANRALIDANQANILELQDDVGALTEDIADLNGDVSDLELRVAANEGEIDRIRTRIGHLDDDVVTLNSALATLRADHETDVLGIRKTISDIRDRIRNLRADLRGLTDFLNNQLAAIRGDISGNVIAIDSMLLELTTTTAMAMSNMSAISTLDTVVDDLEARAAQHELDIIDLQSQINASDYTGMSCPHGEAVVAFNEAGLVCAPVNPPDCLRIGRKAGNSNWGCPLGYRMPNASEWTRVSQCVTPEDGVWFNQIVLGYRAHNVGFSVGGCGCQWNSRYCHVPSVDTFDGRKCGDKQQLHVCVME